MTTIAFDGQILAADTRISGVSADSRFLKLYKIELPNDQILVMAGCGVAAAFAPSVAWFLNDGDPSRYPISEHKLITVMNKRGQSNPRVVLVEGHGHRIALVGPQAEGSGADYALGALYAGASAIDAIKIAAKFDNATNDDIVALNVITGEWVLPPSEKIVANFEAMLDPLLPKIAKPARAKRKPRRK